MNFVFYNLSFQDLAMPPSVLLEKGFGKGAGEPLLPKKVPPQSYSIKKSL